MKFLFRFYFRLFGFKDTQYVCCYTYKKQYWKVLRNHIKLRTIIFFWMEQTQIELCKIGSKGFMEDYNSFMNGFQGVLF